MGKVAAVAWEAERLDSCVRRILYLGVYKRACLLGVRTFVLSCVGVWVWVCVRVCVCVFVGERKEGKISLLFSKRSLVITVGLNGY